MDYFKRFNFLFAAPVFDTDDLEGIRFNQIIEEIQRSGFEVVRARKLEDAEMAVQTDAAIGCMVVDWGKKGMEGKTVGPDQPDAAPRPRFPNHPPDPPQAVRGPAGRGARLHRRLCLPVRGDATLHRQEPDQPAQAIRRDAARRPFFGALVDYAEEGNQLWTCPGHNGGVFYNRSPIGRVFVEHLGESVFRDDLDNSVLDLGDLLTHEGPALKAQKEAAADLRRGEDLFRAQRHLDLQQGRARGALVTDGDLVLFDRNNHKAAHHGALMINGGIPVYVPTIRNAWGLIGPDALGRRSTEKALREAIRNHPLVTDKDAWRKERPFRVAVVEQCTYDGTIHSAEMILKRIGHLCDYILFDEAWAGFIEIPPALCRPLRHGRCRT